MCTAIDSAKYFLLKSNPEIGDTISNLKLQKLLYFAQGFHLAIFEKPLFPESIEAWTHGPVVPKIYHQFKTCGVSGIPVQEINLKLISKNAKNLLDEIWNVYGQFSAWKLRDITHEHTPWKETPRGETIPISSMKSYFKTLVKTA